MTSNDAPILDGVVLADLRASTGGDDDFVRELAQAYVEEGTGYLEAMTLAANAGDPAAIVRPAHTLKSSSATLGAVRLAAIARAIEESGRAGRADGLAEAVDQAHLTWAATLEALAAAGLVA